MMMRVAAGLLLLVVVVGVAHAQITGRATYYDGIDGGTCGFETIPRSTFPFGYIAAANEAAFSGSAQCGKCYQLSCVGPWNAGGCTPACTGSSVVISVTDLCPVAGNAQWCSGDVPHFDLSQPAFDLLANDACGVIRLSYRQVGCPVSGNVIIKEKDGVNAWWFAVFVTNVGGSGGVASVQIKDSASGAVWQTMTRQTYNAWLIQSGPGLVVPLSFKVTTTDDGASLTFTNIITVISTSGTATVSHDAGAQFATTHVFDVSSTASGSVASSTGSTRLSSSTGTTTRSSSTAATTTPSSSSTATVTARSSSSTASSTTRSSSSTAGSVTRSSSSSTAGTVSAVSSSSTGHTTSVRSSSTGSVVGASSSSTAGGVVRASSSSSTGGDDLVVTSSSTTVDTTLSSSSGSSVSTSTTSGTSHVVSGSSGSASVNDTSLSEAAPIARSSSLLAMAAAAVAVVIAL